MPQTTGPGPSIDYDDAGKGELALMLMPGWCASRRAFDNLLPLLSKARRTLALDWRSHGRSARASGDFGAEQLVEDALAVIAASGARKVVPVATAHAGWEAIELRRRLGAQRIPGLVLIDWIVTEAPPPFLDGLLAMQGPSWKAARDGLFGMWLEGVSDQSVRDFVHNDMGTYDGEMWARAGREISAAYARHGSPLKLLSSLSPPAPVLHAFAQPADPGFLKMQQEFGRQQPWFKVVKLSGKSHFPTIETPQEVATNVEAFVAAL